MPARPDQPHDLLRRIDSLERRLAVVERGRRTTQSGQLLGANGLMPAYDSESTDLLSLDTVGEVIAVVLWPFYPASQATFTIRMDTQGDDLVLRIQTPTGTVLGSTAIGGSDLDTHFSVTGDLTDLDEWSASDPLILHINLAGAAGGANGALVYYGVDPLQILGVVYG